MSKYQTQNINKSSVFSEIRKKFPLFHQATLLARPSLPTDSYQIEPNSSPSEPLLHSTLLYLLCVVILKARTHVNHIVTQLYCRRHFLIAILHRDLRNGFFFFSFLILSFTFHILFGILFPFSIWTFTSLFYLDFYFSFRVACLGVRNTG